MFRLIRKAFDLGVTFYNTAEVYGPYTNEELSPQTIIEQVELPEIKYEPWKDSNPHSGRGYY